MNYYLVSDMAPADFETLSLHDALPIWDSRCACNTRRDIRNAPAESRPGPTRNSRSDPATRSCRSCPGRSEEHTSELQSLRHLVCRLLLEKKKTTSPIRLI